MKTILTLKEALEIVKLYEDNCYGQTYNIAGQEIKINGLTIRYKNGYHVYVDSNTPFEHTLNDVINQWRLIPRKQHLVI